ncbi:C4-dicarboxylate ABC transporter permease [Virgibacillus phasianinus]|uniref:C4-dicarboxylate ABC transporter permease n=1 Tax=Virgibacillus phasianinus TaxID=2017483 RepID=A0A220TYA1_9BACI|nr:TRAP transporter small permease [Virgibacillus phasianinus]ASK60964.1 C4-dicarboxylate ABC transporter permease [Virgibacillus phasianinus]
MKALKMIKSGLDRLLLVSALTMLAVMVVVIIIQVFSRQFFSYTPSWSTELSRILFVWVSFLGIAYGFKEKLHIALGLVVNAMPEKVQDLFDYLAKIIVVGLGVLMIYYGWQFTTLMGRSTLPGTGWPSSVLYASIPIAGLFITIYGIELLFKKGMHQDLTDVSEG